MSSQPGILESYRTIYWSYKPEGGILDLFRIFHGWIPILEIPKEPIPLRARIAGTSVVLLIFAMMKNTPVYGLRDTSFDYFFWLRGCIFSTRGSLLELGLLPLTVNSMVIDILDLLDLMDPITTFGDGLRKTSETAVFILVTLFLAVAHISYLPIADDCTCIYVIIQLVVASLITYFLDKILSHFRICSTLTIFILKSACATVIKEGLSLSTTDYGQGAQLDGSLVFLLQSLSTFKSKSLALYRAFFRKDSNLTTFGSTVVVFLTITFLQGVRVDLPVKSKNLFGQHGTFPIKLFYTSHTSFVTQSYIITVITGVSQAVYFTTPDFYAKWLWFLGTWEVHGQSLIPLSGVCYYLTPPSLNTMRVDRIHMVVYLTLILTSCTILSWRSMKNSDNDNSDTLIEDLLGATHLTMSGVKEDSDLALKKEVGRLVSAATILGGLSLGMICVFSDVVGVIGGAHGILVLSSILYSLSEQWKKENAPIQLLG